MNQKGKVGRKQKYNWDKIFKKLPGETKIEKLDLLREEYGNLAHEQIGVKVYSFWAKVREVKRDQRVKESRLSGRDRTENYAAKLSRLMATPTGQKIREYNKAVLAGELGLPSF